MKAPTPEQIRIEAGLPSNASFHGWLIHNPEQDDFLLVYKDNGLVISRKWCPMPEVAMRFNRFTRAYKALIRLEIEHKAIIVASFDLGNQIIVIGADTFRERFMLDSDNPFRADNIKH
ncbi:hypothetical protein [Vibrio scophthalmi]|uniref:Uncharacterized protein n=1 Tax=Vibrio scophthalmi LMG 19158 TaxID=870967 RepID=F9RIN6_9VIBR|nr:hypothetical protein [Vibrio scophthalmi]EGU42105.1 hypothetical protein VIS19158_03102 [Vibrio scophthalmi LMG 19158]